jgi:dihydroorotase
MTTMTETLEELMALYVQADLERQEAADLANKIEFRLIQMMQQDGATEAVTATHKAKIKTEVVYDQSRLMAALEVVAEKEMVAAGAYIPEHEETKTVAAHFNVTKLKPFTKRGAAMKEVLEHAARPGRTSLKVEALKAEGFERPKEE